jgi:UDP-N-acetylmuramoyl-tripeptide--D-alanyl-D-alanine ligase
MAPKITLTLERFVEWSKTQTTLSATALRKPIGQIWHDSRKVGQGDVFVALKTDCDDGHQYVADALAKGALAAVVSKSAFGHYPANVQKKLMVATSPLKAVQRAAGAYRRELGTLVVGITGSNGKTTTRSFISQVLDKEVPVATTVGNWNNHIGLPLSILRMRSEDCVGVFEMGANHSGEIDTLSRIARPDFAIITNIGYSHIGLFGSLQNTTQAKFEIVNGLNTKQGALLLNGDDPRLVAHARTLDVKTVFYGCSRRCAIRAEKVTGDAQGTSFMVDGYTYRLSIPGVHFMYAALPAIALARRLGYDEALIADVLQQLAPAEMRGVIQQKRKVSFVLDCYNANPSSMNSALELLKQIAPESRRVAVLGDMLELGSYAPRLHRLLGALVAQSGIRTVIAVGAMAEEVCRGAREKGMAANALHCVADATLAAQQLRAVAQPGDTVLLKGSRSIGLETTFAAF